MTNQIQERLPDKEHPLVLLLLLATTDADTIDCQAYCPSLALLCTAKLPDYGWRELYALPTG